MKLKYYLRGLGIGVIVAVIIMMIAFRIHGSEMSDEQVIKRAKELGMVMPESGSIADLQEKEQPNADLEEDSAEKDGVDDATDKKSDSGGGSAPEQGQADKETSKKEDAEKAPDNDQENAAAGTADAGQDVQYVTFVVSGGEYSDKISQNLQAAGLIEDAETFNKWMQETDYDNLIQPGTFQIPVGAAWDEIAVILTTKQEKQE